jgi:hypothetical protein
MTPDTTFFLDALTDFGRRFDELTLAEMQTVLHRAHAAPKISNLASAIDQMGSVNSFAGGAKLLSDGGENAQT